MLNKISDQIAFCYRQASQCRELAAEAPDETTRQSLFKMESSWLLLARSYDVTERVSDYVREAERRRKSSSPRRTHRAQNFVYRVTMQDHVWHWQLKKGEKVIANGTADCSVTARAAVFLEATKLIQLRSRMAPTSLPPKSTTTRKRSSFSDPALRHNSSQT
jgi:hypothetical protein